MLPLRVVTESQEQAGWSSAVALSTTYPSGRQPDIDLAKRLATQFEVKGTLCVDLDTLAREAISGQTDDCPAQYKHGVPDFVRSASHVLDYGAQVGSAAPGTKATLTLSYPDPAAAAPGTVEQVTYGEAFTKDAAKGTTTATWTS